VSAMGADRMKLSDASRRKLVPFLNSEPSTQLIRKV
jgi:hypothetical protein